MLNSLISASITQKDTSFLVKVPKRLLDESDKKVVEWVLEYEDQFGEPPTEERFKKTENFSIYWNNVLLATPLADLYQQTINALNFSKFQTLRSDIDEKYDDVGIFDYHKLLEGVEVLTPSSGKFHNAEDIFSNIGTVFADRETSYLPFGIPSLDNCSGGLDIGDFALGLAPVGVGKTTFCCFYAVRAARAKKKVLLLTKEVTKEKLKEKIVAIVGDFNTDLYKRLTDTDTRILKNSEARAMAEIETISVGGGKIFIPDDATYTPDLIKDMMKTEIQETGTNFDLVVVDSFYTLSLKGEEDGFTGENWGDMRRITKKLYDMTKAQGTQTRMLITSQIKPEKKNDIYFTEQDIAFSKGIIQDCDFAFYIARGDASSLQEAQMMWNIAPMKNRSGGLTTIASQMVVDFDTSSLYHSMIVPGSDLSSQPLIIEE